MKRPEKEYKPRRAAAGSSGGIATAKEVGVFTGKLQVTIPKHQHLWEARKCDAPEQTDYTLHL